jgi:hypothetical protein
VADHFEETIGLRVTALEAEAQSVKAHVAELKEFITFSLTGQLGQLRTELKGDIRRVEQRLDGVDRRLDGVEQRLGGRIDGLEQKIDAHHEAMRLILADIRDRLPTANA